MLGSIVLFLNPFVAPVIIKHITSPNIYWRLFYLYPFPLTLAISNAVVITKIRKSKPIIKYPLWITYLVLIVLAFSSSFTKTIFHPGNEVRFPPEYKLPAELNSLAPKIVKHAPEGTMLAPPELSGVIPLFSSSFPQIRVRENGLKLWFDSCGLPPQAANTRIKASEFVGGKDEEFDSFAQFLDAEGKLLNTIVIHQSALDKNVQKQMLRYGFTYRIKVGSYLIFSDTG